MRKLFFAFLGVLIWTGGMSQSARCYDLSTVLKVEPTPIYKQHLDASAKFNINILENSKSINKYTKKGKLVSIGSLGKGYRIQKLDYSRAYLVPKAKTTLRGIAKKFNANTKGSTLTITSLTRTLEDQCRLRRVNPNASLGISSHNYGNSFDISYVRFNDRHKSNPRLEAALEKVLNVYRDEGKLYYIKERQQSCYHITVRNY
ncbi:hypothetical protein BAZ12_04695 [Elizabethkingia miricola]|jgi:hypothetical protein|uniref:Peptidase M15A C-terminal domain-containing protein n=1 Tax=Elizabethkingia miricola TaxID=172045 RepID=A0ABD4DLM7_ELIMR|nr:MULTISPECIES: DUF5715 family protein [Elizabethkingia]KUY19681.1 hypothetical protein ATB95_01740 [Elizabethkingia miricola]MCL1651315.1 DUF5715 family protein [Elizabethkingia miricola]MCL1678425.1 DUF5715 family protein [Elizabethkingia miricola]OPC71353.1 hypothetical protein BAZ13_07770 [Elizabethkingia miricola]OPC73096.1 hypothetical protein BAZ12_04695 [Elizabethkingia miricola]